MPLTHDEIEKRTTYHKPTWAAELPHLAIRNCLRDALGVIDDNCPDSREKSVAITELETAMFWANAAIARNHDKL